MPNKTTKTPPKKSYTVQHGKRLASRSSGLRFDATGAPSSLDEATRSIAVVASTEQPVMVMDWERWEMVPEVLLMSGCVVPPSGRTPYLDTHSRFSVSNVIGSFRNISVVDGESGKELHGRCYYSKTPDGEAPYQKTIEGHVTDVSVGYEINAFVWVEDGKTVEIEGRSFEGPMRVVTSWQLKELSLCPIGADDLAKFRSQHKQPAFTAGHKKELNMAKKGKASGKRKATSELEKVLQRRERVAKAEAEAARLRILAARAEAEQELDEDGVERAEDEELDADGVERAEDEELDADGEEREDEEDEEREDDEDEEREDDEEDTQRRRSSSGSQRSQLTAVQQERSRVLQIQKMCRSFDIQETIEKQLINKGTSVNSARKQVMDMVQTRGANGGHAINVGVTEQQKVRAAMRDGLALRCGHKVEKPAPGAEQMRSYTLREITKECLARAGKSTSGDIREVVGRALTTTDLPMLLQETAARTLMEAFNTAPETWPQWCNTGQVSDFKTNTSVGIDSDFTLKEIGQSGEYENAELSEQAEEYKIASFGRKVSVSRESIINDDLQALTTIPESMGRASAKLLGDIAYGALLANGKMGDGKPLFHAAHNNLHAGKGGIPTIENIDVVQLAMGKQTNKQGELLSIIPEFFIAPLSLRTTAEQFFNTTLGGQFLVGTGDKPLVHNPFGGSFFTRIYEARLDGVSAFDWFLAAKRAVTMYFLNGVQNPFIEQYETPGQDGVSWRVRMDAGAKAMRWQTIAKATK